MDLKGKINEAKSIALLFMAFAPTVADVIIKTDNDDYQAIADALPRGLNGVITETVANELLILGEMLGPWPLPIAKVLLDYHDTVCKKPHDECKGRVMMAKYIAKCEREEAGEVKPTQRRAAA